MNIILEWLFKPFTYWLGFFKEFMLWAKFNSTTKKNRKIIEKANLRVDWIGRVYGVVNIPDEVLGAAEEIQQAYVLKQMGSIGRVMDKIGVSNIVYPQLSEITGAGAYLVVFWPVLDKLNGWNIIGHILYSIAYFFLFYLLIRLFIVNNWIGVAWEAISSIL